MKIDGENMLSRLIVRCVETAAFHNRPRGSRETQMWLADDKYHAMREVARLGGGTSFEAADTTLRPRQGEMLSHFGRLRHAGEPVVQGTRYILAGFVRVRPLAAAWRDIKTPVGCSE